MASHKITIHSYTPNPNVFKSLITAKFAGVEVDVPKDFKFGTDNKTEEFFKKNPLGKVPTADTADGPLWESNAIARYIARIGHDKGLLGETPYQQALVDQWIDFTSFYLTPHLFPLVGFRLGFGPYDAEKFNVAFEAQKQAWGWLEKHFTQHGSKYLTGNRITLADIILLCSSSYPLTHALDKDFRAAFPKTDAYFHAVYVDPHVKEVVGEVKFLEKLELPQ